MSSCRGPRQMSTAFGPRLRRGSMIAASTNRIPRMVCSMAARVLDSFLLVPFITVQGGCSPRRQVLGGSSASELRHVCRPLCSVLHDTWIHGVEFGSRGFCAVSHCDCPVSPSKLCRGKSQTVSAVVSYVVPDYGRSSYHPYHPSRVTGTPGM